MKRNFPTLVLVSLLAVLFVPMIASAQPPECCRMKRAVTIDTVKADPGAIVGPKDGYCPIGAITVTTENWGLFCLMNTINAVVDWIFIFLIAVTVIFVLMGAATILTAAGSPEKVATGRNYILYAVIGLLLAFVARAVPSVVRAVVGY